MKTVFSNSMCAHVWAQQTQPHGHSDSMSFDGAVAYSYREPVAHIAHTPGGGRVALFRSQRFNLTTDRHMYQYSSAVSRDIPPLFTLGLFRLDSIDGHSGTIKAGCHTIHRAEIERLALAAGWLTVGHDGNGSEVVS